MNHLIDSDPDLNSRPDQANAWREQVQLLTAQLEQRNHQLTALFEIGWILAATLDPREIYRVMFREIAQKILGTPHLIVALFEAATQMIHCDFAIVDGVEIDPAQFPPLPLGAGPLSETIRTAQPRIVDLAREYLEPGAKAHSSLIGEGPVTQSALYVPMISNAHVLGVMQVQHYAANAFQETDLALLSILANQAAIAFEKARLYASVQRYAGELERHVAERTRELAEANERLQSLDRLKDQFVSNVSHELRTPLANVKLFLQLLTSGRPDKHEEYLQTLQRETRRLERLIDDLLDLSQLDLNAVEFYLEPTDVNGLVADFIQDRIVMAQERKLAIACQLAPELPQALIDPQRFTQIMSNLMTNAMNYTPSGGLLTFSTAVQRYDDTPWVTFSLHDTGQGIPEQELPHVFERFFRGVASRKTGIPGTGLGLAICQEIVQRLEGQITVRSQPGQGTAFTVWLRPVF